MTRKPKIEPILAILNNWGSVEYDLEHAGALTADVTDLATLLKVVNDIDAIVLTGGGDVSPEVYGDTRHRLTSGVDSGRDQLELAAVKMARERSLPILGICRGHQLLNVAYGGTLTQHVPDLPHTRTHGNANHAVALNRKSRVARQLRRRILTDVVSLHHQAVDRLGDGLIPAGWAKDGLVEMIESVPGAEPYVLGCQFHPEMAVISSPWAESLFKMFVGAARSVAVHRGSTLERWARVCSATDPMPKATEWDDWQAYTSGARDDRAYWDWQEEHSAAAWGVDERGSCQNCTTPSQCEMFGECEAIMIQRTFAHKANRDRRP